jgi:transposase-like protein
MLRSFMPHLYLRKRGELPEEMNKYERLVKPRLCTVRELLADGNTVNSVAEKLGVSASSLRRYCKDYPELAEIFRESAECADDRVEAALLRRAVGYDIDSGDGEKSRHVPADVKAAVFWLKNRRPKRWQDNSRTSSAADITVKLVNEEISL